MALRFPGPFFLRLGDFLEWCNEDKFRSDRRMTGQRTLLDGLPHTGRYEEMNANNGMIKSGNVCLADESKDFMRRTRILNFTVILWWPF